MRTPGPLSYRAVAAAVATLCCAASPTGAQVAPDGWNSDAALRLIDRAIEARRHAWVDSSLQRFRADAQGHLYYLGDFQGNRHIIRADQIALDVRWQAPDRTMQTIVGRRHEVRLPTNIEYHVDHLFLVLDNFGDRIRLGDGYEVENVLHPAAAGARHFYEYRLADSLEIRIRGRTARVFAVEVRPRVATDPAAVGSVFVDRETGAIARMRLTFTRAAYRDPQLVRIVLDLRSALWEGRHWLPIEQDVEITRSLPWFDFPLETLIRTQLRVLDYHFDEEPAFRLSPGQYVYAYHEDDLARFDAWESPLTQPAEGADRDLERVVSHARRLLRRQGLFGGRRLQLALPNASAGIRARRAEGLFVGAGAAYRVDDLTGLSFWGGYPTGEARPQASLGLRRSLGRLELELDGWLRANRDAGPVAAAGAFQTLALLAEGEDYQDPYFASGGRIGIARETGSARWRIGVSVESHEAADLVVRTAPFGDRPLRPVRLIDEGELAALDVGLEVDLGRGLGALWGLDLAGEAATGSLGSFGYSRARVAVGGARQSLGGAWTWATQLEFGFSGGALPAQRLFLLGGRGSLPGHPFRGWGGDRMGLWRAEVSHAAASPWVRLRALGAVGWADLGAVGEDAARRFGAIGSSGLRASAGLGLGLFYDLLRVDLVRGFGGDSTRQGDWTVLLSLDPRLWGIL
ncbi:hypothetical protein [Candidatus Palauibacter sp.]|uniref:hypothetical protein n=1 Tax=Candidatus Palauibacter sp. TaxID=3101350 RepID=UPI003AF2628E